MKPRGIFRPALVLVLGFCLAFGLADPVAAQGLPVVEVFDIVRRGWENTGRRRPGARNGEGGKRG